MDNKPSPSTDSTVWYLEWALLNVHFHMRYLDGVYAEDAYGKIRFHRIKAPTVVAGKRKIGRIKGFLIPDVEGVFPNLEFPCPNSYLHEEVSGNTSST